MVIGINGEVLYERSAPSGGINTRFNLPDGTGIQVIRTNHRGGAASGRHDTINYQRLVTRVAYLKDMTHLRPLGYFPEIILRITGRDPGSIDLLG